jgi:choline dehydrogenase-like flavoprotein
MPGRLLRHDGLGATNHFESGGFVRSRSGVPYPDLQYHFLPLAVRYDGRLPASGHGFQAHVGPLRSPSRGWVRLASADPAAAPRIRFNYMSHPDDWTDMRAAVRLTREIFAQSAFDRYRGGRSSRATRCGRMPRSTPSCAKRSRAPIIPVALAGWDGRTIRGRWSIPRVA